MSYPICLGWLTGIAILVSLVHSSESWGQERPPIQLPEVVIVGQEVRRLHEDKHPLSPSTLPLGLQEIVASQMTRFVPPLTETVEGPTAENPGCLLFPRLLGGKDAGVYRRGLRQYQAGHYGEAATLFQRVIQEYPHSPYRGAATFWAGEAIFRQDRDAEALPYYERVIAAPPHEPLRDYALLRAAMLYRKRQELAQAVAVLQDLRTAYPASPTIEPALYLSGETAFRQGQYPQALEVLQECLRRYPQSMYHEQAEFLRAESLYHLGNYQEARAAYHTFLERYGQGLLAREARHSLGWTLFRLGDVALAQQLWESPPGQADSRLDETRKYAMFLGALQVGDVPTAQREAEQLRQRFPQSPLALAALSDLAWENFSRKQYAVAAALYQQLLQEQGTPQRLREVAQYMLGECRYQQADYPAALDAWQRLAATPVAAIQDKVAFRLGLVFFQQQQYAEAIEAFQTLLARYPATQHYDDAVFWLGEAHFQRQEYAAALEVYGRLQPDSRLYDHALYGRGWVAIRQQQWQQALDLLQQLVTQFPQSRLRADALYRVAELQQNLGHSPQARQGYEQYLTEFPTGSLAAAAQLQMALLGLRTDRFEDAQQAFQRVQRQFPGTIQAGEADYWLGMVSFRNKRFAEARHVFQQLSDTAPDHPRAPAALLRVADTYYNEKRFQNSLIAYQKVGILYPKAAEVADARYGVMLSYYQLQQYPPFLREARLFTQDYSQHPLNVTILQHVAEYHQDQGRTDEAIATYLTLTQKYPQSLALGKTLLRLGELYTASGQPQQAIAVYERALRQAAGTARPDALLRLGQVYETLGDSQAALRHYEQLAVQHPENAVAARGLLAAARLLTAQQQYPTAQRYLETIVRQYPQEPLRYESMWQLGMVHLAQRQPERAIAVLQQAEQASETRLAANIQLQLGHAYSAAGNRQQGVNVYLRIPYLYPQEQTLVIQALRAAATNYVTLRKCVEAQTVYTKLLKLAADTPIAQDVRQEMTHGGCDVSTPPGAPPQRQPAP